MTNTVTAEFNLRELSDIISVCEKSQVQSLDLGPIKILFKGLPSNADLPKNYSDIETDSAEIGQPKVELTAVDRQLFEDARQAQLMLEDPAAYEQQIIDAHLQDGSSDGERV